MSMTRAAYLAAVALLAVFAFGSATSQAAPPAGQNHHWYVSASAPPGGDGTIHAPFNSLAAVEQLSSPGDTIVIEPSPLDVPPLDGGIALKSGQRLVGGGPPVVQLGQPVLQGGAPLATSTELASQPRIANTSGATNNGDAVELANDTDVANLVIDGSYRGGIYGQDVTGVRVHGNDVSGQNTSGTIGYINMPVIGESYVPYVGALFEVPHGWAAIMIDETTVSDSVSIEHNYVHDGTCGDGIDVRASNTADVTAHVEQNFLTRFGQCSSGGLLGTDGIGTQASGSSTLRAYLDRNTEANLGSPSANPPDNPARNPNFDGSFVNIAGSGTLTVIIDHNTFVHNVGGSSDNGLEWERSFGARSTGHVTIENSTFQDNPGDMLEMFNRGVGSETTLTLDHVLVKNTTFSGGLPSYANPPGTARGADNTGECLGIASVGAGNRTVLQMRHSQFLGCDNNGIEVTNNHVTSFTPFNVVDNGTFSEGVGNPQTVSLDIDDSKISGSRYYNLWVNNLTPLGQLQVRVQNSDLSTSGSGVAIGFDQQPTGSTESAAIDLGGGALGSKGRNCIFGGAIYDLETQGFNVTAENNWWGAPSGPVPGKVVATAGGSVDDSDWLTHPASACTQP